MPEHGSLARYEKRGCRCSECREANAAAGRAYAERRKAQGRPIQFARATVARECEHCSSAFLARGDAVNVGRGRFCSDACARKAQGWDGTVRDRWRPSAKLRAEIFERFGGVCVHCSSPVRVDVPSTHPRYPNLDHIKPRSRGGSDDASNLQLACRQCNVLRGADESWVYGQEVV